MNDGYGAISRSAVTASSDSQARYYDTDGQLTNIKNTDIALMRITYDENGAILKRIAYEKEMGLSVRFHQDSLEVR